MRISRDHGKGVGCDWTDGSTLTFSNVVYETPTAKQNLAIRFNDLPNDPVYIGGTTVQDKNTLKWDMASDTIDTSGITSYAATSETAPSRWTGGRRDAEESFLDADGKITGYLRTGRRKASASSNCALTNPPG